LIHFYRIDSYGFYVEPVLMEQNEDGSIPTRDDLILIPIPEGLYQPKWDGTQWIEGGIGVSLEAKKSLKLEELDKKCSESILGNSSPIMKKHRLILLQ
jgi:hypothetical protein